MQGKIRDLFAREIENGDTFGGAAAVLCHGETVFSETYGDSRFGADSLYRLASVTKIFTAAAVLQLVDAGKLSLAASVETYLQGWKTPMLGRLSADGRVYADGASPRPITLFDLLTHTAGLGADEVGNREYAVMPTEAKTSLASVTEYYKENFHLAFAPGTRMAYSGFAGYDLLSRIVEVVSGERFNDYLQHFLFAPLGMTDTTFQPTDAQYARLVPMHKRVQGESKEVDFRGALFRGLPRTYEAGGAALISSMADMLRFAKMLLGKGELDGVRVLRAETVDRMLSAALGADTDGLIRGENVGLGCFLRGKQVYSHGAYGTHLLLLPEQGIAAVLLKNSLTGMSADAPLARAFTEAVLEG